MRFYFAGSFKWQHSAAVLFVSLRNVRQRIASNMVRYKGFPVTKNERLSEDGYFRRYS
jgi:hypothetical protein